MITKAWPDHAFFASHGEHLMDLSTKRTAAEGDH